MEAVCLGISRRQRKGRRYEVPTWRTLTHSSQISSRTAQALHSFCQSSSLNSTNNRDEFAVGPRILNDQQIEALREELSELTRSDHPGSHLLLGAWGLRPDLHNILWDAKFTVPASQLLGCIILPAVLQTGSAQRSSGVTAGRGISPHRV
eukprot:777947-Rhodomonas_salina.4